MNAIAATRYGGPDVLVPVDLEPEPLGRSDIRISVTAAAVSPTDTLRRSGAQAEPGAAPPPGGAVPGMDVAGEVAELGADVDTGLAVGDRVVGIVVPDGNHGGYRADLVLPAASVVRSPTNADDAAASTLPMNGLTARVALDQLALAPGDTVAITGSAGAFGGYAIQLAKADGLTVIADASEADEQLVRELGADVVVRRGDGVADRILDAVPGGVDGLCDGTLQGADLLPAVKDGGRMITVRGWDGAGQDRVTVIPIFVGQWATRSHDQLESLVQQVESGAVTLRVADVLPAEQAPEAHRRLEAGGVRGRLVLQF